MAPHLSQLRSVVFVLFLIGSAHIGRAYDAQVRGVTVPGSPSVLVTLLNSEDHLRLAVLWRGSANWWSRASGHAAAGYSGGVDVFGGTLEYGGTSLAFSYDSRKHSFEVRGKPMPVPAEANIILIDDVDSSAGPKLAGAFYVDPADSNVDPKRGSLGSFFSRSEKVVDFLRCGVGEKTKKIDAMACADIVRR